MARRTIDGQQYDVYEPKGAALDMFRNRDTVCIMDGPVRSGKTRAWLEKIHACLIKYPGSRAMFVRETLASLRDTVLETFENHVLTPGFAVSAINEEGNTVSGNVAAGASRGSRMGYKYPNGSEIVLKGLSDDSRILSGEYEMIGVCQLEECGQSSLNTLLTRLSGRHMPYRQIVGDCNPGAPTHWIKQNCQMEEGGSGFLTLLHSTHRENPVLFDSKADDWTEFGKSYMAALWSMPDGFQKDRMLHGKWVSAEGARWVIDPAKHIFRMNEKWPYGVPSGQRILVGMDWGSHAPFAAVWMAIDTNKDAYIFREAYERGLTTDQQAERVVQMTGQNERVHAIYPDPSIFNTNSGGNKMIADYYRDVFARDKRFGPVLEGERALNRRKQGMATIDAMLGRDNGFPDLYIEQSCTELLRELSEARWWQPKHGQAKEDIDPACDDHCLTAETLVLTKRGEVPIASVTTSDEVMTRKGWRKVTRAWKSGTNAKTVDVTMSNGRTLIGTPNHRVWSQTRNAWVQMGALERHELLCVLPSMLRLSSGMESSSGDTLSPIGTATECISDRIAGTFGKALRRCTERYGRPLWGQSLRDATSTIRTATQETTHSRTWNALPVLSTVSGISRTVANIATKTSQKCLTLLARFAESLGRLGCIQRTYVLQGAAQQIGGGAGSITLSGFAGAETSSLSIGSRALLTVPVHVLGIRSGKSADVYDLTVEGEHEFVAEGVIVHNSITATYYALNQWYTAPEESKPIPTHAETLALVQKDVYERELKHFARTHTGGRRIRV